MFNCYQPGMDYKPHRDNVIMHLKGHELRVDLSRSGLSDEVLGRLRTIAGNRITSEDVLVIDARAARTQAENREDARGRLADLVRRALVRPKRRRKTRPTKASKERRLDAKRRHSSLKRRRSAREQD